MLLVQLTALVVWIAQYVSAAEESTIYDLFRGDALHSTIGSVIGNHLSNSFYFDVPIVK